MVVGLFWILVFVTRVSDMNTVILPPQPTCSPQTCSNPTLRAQARSLREWREFLHAHPPTVVCVQASACKRCFASLTRRRLQLIISIQNIFTHKWSTGHLKPFPIGSLDELLKKSVKKFDFSRFFHFEKSSNLPNVQNCEIVGVFKFWKKVACTLDI